MPQTRAATPPIPATPILESQRIELRAGDDLPGFAARLEDEHGNPLDMTDCKARLLIVSDLTGDPILYTEVEIINPAQAIVQFDWEAAVTATWEPGYYWVSVRSISNTEWSEDGLGGAGYGPQIEVAPSARNVMLVVRPMLVEF